MVNGRMIAAVVLLASAIGLLSGAREARVPGGARTLVANAPEAGVIAMAGPGPGRIRVLFARNGGMVLQREISVPGAGEVRELSLSADGNDLFVATDTTAYALSTRTGHVEAQALATGDARGPQGRDVEG
jgi:hypothetical protein